MFVLPADGFGPGPGPGPGPGSAPATDSQDGGSTRPQTSMPGLAASALFL